MSMLIQYWTLPYTPITTFLLYPTYCVLAVNAEYCILHYAGLVIILDGRQGGKPSEIARGMYTQEETIGSKLVIRAWIIG